MSKKAYASQQWMESLLEQEELPSEVKPQLPKTDLDAVRKWAEDNKVLAGHAQRKTRCQCGQEVAVFTVKKDGVNQGRLFAKCDHCGRWQWLDMPLCRKCGERKFQAQTKAGKWFLACPNRCSLRWLSQRHRGGGYEVV
jgi:hypothetical protein